MSARDPLCGFPLDPEKTNFKTVFLANQYFFDSEYCMRSFVHGPKVGYFSMEIGVNSNMPTYSSPTQLALPVYYLLDHVNA